MCTLVGYVSSKKHKKDMSNILKLIKYRSLDSNGIYEDIIDDDSLVGFGHTLLSIIDLIDKNYVLKIITDHTNKVKNNTLKIYQLSYLSYWYKNNFKD